jgi:hypothetical protein
MSMREQHDGGGLKRKEETSLVSGAETRKS